MVINADSTGIAGIHGRRPVVSITELAQEWLAPTSPIKGAEQIVLHQGEPIEAFEWFKVDTTVRSLTKDGRLSIQTIKPVYS
ncbi:hypothetical protein JET67_25000 [Pseudomonas palleroniana]|nr:hypothetical protein [Pseudomonas palleroniana]